MKRYKKLAIAGVALSIVATLAGCATADNGTTPASNSTSNSQKQTSTINPPGNLLPSLVKWNGISYITKGYIHNVGAKVGVANDGTQKWNVFVLPGYSPQNEIAVEVNNPNGKYVEANAPVTGQNSPLTVDYDNHGYGVILQLVPPKSIGREIYQLRKVDEIIIGDGGTFPIGTKLFAIKNVPVNRSIAVEINTNTYLQANLQGWFPPSSNTSS
ncbi:hypothetical protein [Alicyclobacillus mengziensis]|uniref:DUF4352 domain-containing protein n=1 Tax=Alicyclobacillus mengziensis TaxID=2931921 RepID=A0A9X7VVI2_9BACL|nr:hypothetical protein [Alicyclobacillus mengziensis]QSO45640.1 hypothetical protein JZ786_13850 [Alicyclobacillus mengziensis]